MNRKINWNGCTELSQSITELTLFEMCLEITRVVNGRYIN